LNVPAPLPRPTSSQPTRPHNQLRFGSQSWDLDALGNFDSQTTDGTGQTWSYNKRNEIKSVSSATTPNYDSAGDMTGDETGKQFVYDAFGRLVVVKDSGGSTLAT
jgi:YD repeat-containing protein